MANDPLANEQVTFIQHDLPGLDDGEYQLKVSQKVDDSTGAPINDESIDHTYTFAVQGDRFMMANPQQSIYSVFPSENSSGEFTNVLPHVVFTKTSLPWSRYPTTHEPVTGLSPGEDTDEDVPTWLTILLLDEDDVASFSGLELAPQNATIGDLFPTSLNSASTLGTNYSYFNSAQNTSLEVGQALTDTIQVLDIPMDLFWNIAPTIDDLKLMAHVRKVSLINKPTMPGVSDVGEPTGSFSIVFGNRLPQTKKKTFAFLVSLEELQVFLPDSEDGGAPSGSSFDGSKFMRLAVLKSWSFYSTGQSATFVDQLLELNGREADSATDAPITNLRLPYAGTNTVVGNALDMGFVPLNENLRTPDGKTVSWYRGPLIPYKISTPSVDLPIPSPDKITFFDPTTGMFDLSYASAWSIGRLIALQDKSFSVDLYNWKRGLSQQVVEASEQGIIQEHFDNILTLSSEQNETITALEATGKKVSPVQSLLHTIVKSLKEIQ
jgi:hypothetical protein